MSYETRLRKLESEKRSSESGFVIVRHEYADDRTLTAYVGPNGERFERQHGETFVSFQARYRDYWNLGRNVVLLSETDARL